MINPVRLAILNLILCLFISGHASAFASLDSVHALDDGESITAIAPHAPVAATFVSSDEGQYIAIRKLPDGEELFRIPYPERTVMKMALSDDGKQLAVSSGGPIWLWSVTPKSEPSLLNIVDYQRTRALDFAFCDDGKSLVATYSYGMVAVFSTANGEAVSQHRFGRRDIRVENKYMAACLKDDLIVCTTLGKIMTMGRRTNGFSPDSTVDFDPMSALTASSQSGHIVIGEPNGTLSVWTNGSDKPLSRKLTDLDSVTCLVLSKSGTMLLAGGTGGRVEVFSVPDLKLLMRFKRRSAPIQSIGFGAGEQSVITASNGRLFTDNLAAPLKK